MELNIIATIVAPILAALLAFFLTKILRTQPKLMVYYSHISSHTLPDHAPPQNIINLHSIVVMNIGNSPAKNVRVGHNIKSISYNVIPKVNYYEDDMELLFPIMVPEDQITINYLYYPPITVADINTYVKSDEGTALVTKVIPDPNTPLWQKRVGYFLSYIGTAFLIYLAIKFIILIYKCASNFS